MRTNLICTTCRKPITIKREGMFVWGRDTKKFPFMIVHKGVCDNRNDYIYSMEVEDLVQRVNRKLTKKEVKNPV